MKDLSRRQQAILQFIERLSRRERLSAHHPRHPDRARHLVDQRRRLQPQGARGARPDPPQQQDLARHRAGEPRRRAAATWWPSRSSARSPPVSRSRCPATRGLRRRPRRSSSALICVPDSGQGLFALRVKGHSMIDALINDGDVVVLRQQETCENGETVAVWLKDQRETTLKRFYLEGDASGCSRPTCHGSDLHAGRERRDPGPAGDGGALLRVAASPPPSPNPSPMAMAGGVFVLRRYGQPDLASAPGCPKWRVLYSRTGQQPERPRRRRRRIPPESCSWRPRY